MQMMLFLTYVCEWVLYLIWAGVMSMSIYLYNTIKHNHGLTNVLHNKKKTIQNNY